MKQLTVLGIVAIAVLGLTGCGVSGTTDVESAAPAETLEIAGEEMTVELGCGGCIYKMEGISSCVTAAKVGETAMLVEGGGVNAHEAGLCEAPRMATVVGEVKDGKLHASSITLN